VRTANGSKNNMIEALSRRIPEEDVMFIELGQRVVDALNESADKAANDATRREAFAHAQYLVQTEGMAETDIYVDYDESHWVSEATPEQRLHAATTLGCAAAASEASNVDGFRFLKDYLGLYSAGFDPSDAIALAAERHDETTA
jgi:hypothetical protein